MLCNSGRAGRFEPLVLLRVFPGLNTFSNALLLSKEQLIKICQPPVLETQFETLMMEDSMTQQQSHNLSSKEHFIFTKKWFFPEAAFLLSSEPRCRSSRGKINPIDYLPRALSTNCNSEPPSWFVYLMTFLLERSPRLY